MNEVLNPYLNMLSGWKQIKGTLGRREYWSAFLTMLIILCVFLWFAEKIPVTGILVKIYLLLMAVPFYTATVRRLHDCGKSAWNLLYLLIPIVGMMGVFLFLVSDGKEDSRFPESVN